MFHVAELLRRNQGLSADVVGNLAGLRAALEGKGGGRADRVERKDMMDRDVFDRAPRHLIVRGVGRVLNHGQATAALDRSQARRAVVEEAGEQHANHSRRATRRGRAKERIDRPPRAVLPWPAAHVNVVVPDDQVAVGRRDDKPCPG